jgi:DNA polymerase
MGLAPVWRRRAAAAGRGAGDAADDTVIAAEPVAASERAVAAGRTEAAAGRARAPAQGAIADGRASMVDPARAARIAALDWEALREDVGACTACSLCRTRKQTVFGTGVQEASWMIVGEAPGAEEDARGEPFVGQAGRLLDNMLAAIGRSRGADVYIANVLKCRPPGNRNPEPLEVAQCSPYMVRQIELARPRLLVAMGRFAAQTLLGTDASIAALRGRVHRYHGVPCVVTYHPAYLLRNLADKARAWEDLCFARGVARDLESGAVRPS